MSRNSGRKSKPAYLEECDRCCLRFMGNSQHVAAGKPTGREVNEIGARSRIVLQQLWNDGEYERMDSYLQGVLEKLPLCARCEGRKVIHRDVLLDEARDQISRLQARVKDQETAIGDLEDETAEHRDYQQENRRLRSTLEVYEQIAHLLEDHDRGIRDWHEVMAALSLVPDRLADIDFYVP